MKYHHPSQKFFRYARASKNQQGRLFRFKKQTPAPAGYAQKTVTFWTHLLTQHDTITVDLYYQRECVVSASRSVADVWYHAKIRPSRYIEVWWEELTEKLVHVLSERKEAP